MMAGPDVYRSNSFRILGVLADAASPDIRREQKRREMQQKLGMAATNSAALLPTNDGDDPEVVRGALDRLRDPVDRFLQELFWFSGSSEQDAGLDALRSGNVEEARQQWAIQSRDGATRTRAIQNLAILDHVNAIEAEIFDADLWKSALSRWNTLVSSDLFWEHLASRIDALSDARLSTELLQRVRNSLPVALISINAKLALAEADEGNEAAVREHLEIVENSPFGKATAEEAVRAAAEARRNKLTSLIETARQRWPESPQKGADVVRSLHDLTHPILKTIDMVFASNSYLRSAIRDSVADAMLDGQIAYASKTHEWEESIELLRLALGVAFSDSMKERLEDSIRQIEENIEEGNHWYTPGYWDLPPGITGPLESAREKTLARDYQGALDILLVLDAGAGYPLTRCTAFALSQRAWQIANFAFQDFQEPTERLSRFLATLERRGSIARPSPEMQSWELPECPCCCDRSYTSWVNGEYRGQAFWMCGSCSRNDDRQVKNKKSSLAKELKDALQYALLAREVDPDDQGLKDTVEKLSDTAAQFDAGTPETTTLRTRLERHDAVGARRDLRPKPPAQLQCHFCGSRSADGACEIRVPMCGDVQRTNYVLGNGTSFAYGDAIVMRCRHCRDEHREFPERLAKWQAALSDITSDDEFPAEMDLLRDAEKKMAVAKNRVNELTLLHSDAEYDRRMAEKHGSACPDCGDENNFKDGICCKCDRQYFSLPVLGKLLVGALSIAAAALSAWFIAGFQLPAMPPQTEESLVDMAIALAIGVVVGSLAWGSMRMKLRARRASESEVRMRRIADERESKMRAATKTIGEYESRISQANKNVDRIQKAVDVAIKQLEAAKERAVQAFQRSYPKPELAAGVKPEDAWDTATTITELLKKGWGYGNSIKAGGAVNTKKPGHLDGLVAGRKPKGSGPKRAKPSGGTVRDELLTIARNAQDDDLLPCPCCDAKIKSKNLILHYDRNHANER